MPLMLAAFEATGVDVFHHLILLSMVTRAESDDAFAIKMK